MFTSAASGMVSSRQWFQWQRQEHGFHFALIELEVTGDVDANASRVQLDLLTWHPGWDEGLQVALWESLFQGQLQGE